MRIFTFFLVLCCAGLLSAQTEHQVSVTSNVFTPADLTIQVGDMVTWTNNGGTHNVNGSLATYPGNPEEFRSGNAAPPGWVFSHTFTIPGAYDYRCDPHFNFGMAGTITVEAAPTAMVVITEIMYNPPESNADSLEYIELYNAGTDPANLLGWTFSEGVVDTFGDVTIAAGEYLIVAKNANAFTTTFNYTGAVEEWMGGSLSNGGEDIELKNAVGIVVDYVDFDDALPWPLGADGEGASIVLCDFLSDNTVPGNWQAAATPTGFIINGIEMLANPGAASECGVVEPSIYWLSNNAFVNEDAGTLTFEIIIQNFNTIGVSFALDLGSETTATVTADFMTNPGPLPQTYTDGFVSLDTVEITVTIVDDNDIEADEIIVLALQPNTGTVLGDSLLTITIFDNDSEVVVSSIGDINGIDADGVGDFVDSVRTVQGIVHCMDFDGNEGLSFWIIEPDTRDGINVFSFTDVNDYQVTEGDELQVTGEIEQFRGLLEIVPNMITVVSTGNDLVPAEGVTTLDESTESRYVELILSSETPTTDFITTAGGGFNVSVVSQDGDSLLLRVEFETDIDSAFVADFFTNAAPGSNIVVNGIGSQRTDSFDPPFLTGYQMFPCSQSSFGFTTSTRDPEWATELNLYPNPTNGLLTVELPFVADQYRLMDSYGRQLLSGQVITERFQLSLSALPVGVYFLQILDEGEVVTRSIIRQ